MAQVKSTEAMQELVCVVTADDVVIGPALRSEVHGNPNLIHRVAHVLVFNSKNELYLQKRALTKQIQPGKWDTSVGGHVDMGETYLQAARREMKEELGIMPETIEFLYKYRHTNDIESEYVSTFHCQWDQPITVNREEISEGRFWQISSILAQADDGVFTPNFLDELQRYHTHVKQRSL